MSDPMTDEELRVWAVIQAGGDVGRAKGIVGFVRPDVAIALRSHAEIITTAHLAQAQAQAAKPSRRRRA